MVPRNQAQSRTPKAFPPPDGPSTTTRVHFPGTHSHKLTSERGAHPSARAILNHHHRPPANPSSRKPLSPFRNQSMRQPAKMHTKLPILLSVLPLAASASSSTILSCADVLCPLANDSTTSAQCTLLDTSYTAVGVASVPSRPDLAWVQAVTAHDARDLDGDGNPNPNPDNPMKRTFIKDFFLASEPGAGGGGGGACALFFRNVTKDADWPAVPSHTTSQGTCADAIGEACVEAMVKRARAVDVAGLEVEEACEKVKREFERAGGEEGGGVCKRASGTEGWRGVVGRGECFLLNGVLGWGRC